MEEAQVDNQATETTGTDTGIDSGSSTQQDSASVTTQQDNQEVDKPYSPFSSGKEKFKVRGQEVEWDWNETKKWAQLNHSGYQAMEQAKTIEKKAQTALQQMYEAANRDPEGFIRTFNPNYKAQAQHAQAANGQPGSEEQSDPRDSAIQRLERELESLKSGQEQRSIAEEKQLIAKEIESAFTAYPTLKNVLKAEQLVKAEYARQLRLGNDQITIDDVAFHMSQEAQESEKKRMQATKHRLDQNRKTAPVSTSPTGGSGQSKGMTRDEVRKLAGLPPA